jgi:hypothetical protein
LQPLNYTFNVCDQLGSLASLICPMPLVDASVSGNVPLPADVSFDLPGLAWTVPDLEAYAQVSVTTVDNNTEVACVSVISFILFARHIN